MVTGDLNMLLDGPLDLQIFLCSFSEIDEMLRTRKYELHCQMKYLLELLTVELEKKKKKLFVFTSNVYNTELDFTMFRSHLMEPYRDKSRC